jgi:uncharacterized protein YkwD
MPRLRIAVAAVGVLAAMAAASPAHAACAGADVMPSRGNAAKVNKATLCLLNAERRAHKLHRLVSNRRLRHVATRYSRFMVRHAFFAHEGPRGSTPVSRIRRTHYLRRARAWSIGENLAWGTGDLATPRAIVRAWMHSPEHRANILNGRFREIGIGIARGAPVTVDAATRGATYATDFGYRG